MPSDPANRDIAGRFGPGNVANPSGRPKIVNGLRAYIAGEEGIKTRADVEAIRHIAAHDDDSGIRLQALKFLVEQVLGKAPQAITAEDGAATLFGVVLLPADDPTK